jgi:hypothetical protein
MASSVKVVVGGCSTQLHTSLKARTPTPTPMTVGECTVFGQMWGFPCSCCDVHGLLRANGLACQSPQSRTWASATYPTARSTSPQIESP